MLLSVGPDTPEPELPNVRMKTATGYQERQAKAGDPEYVQWQKEKVEYGDLRFELHKANAIVHALKDSIDWSQYDLTQPPPASGAQEMYKNKWPDHDLLRKKAWIDWTILFKRKDEETISRALDVMRGVAEPTEGMVNEVKKNSDSSLEPSKND
ncbi:MAG: hypothetical protein ACYSQZ_05575 [Planctomycetota bacterium]|jgi:hypothetical protein